MNSDVLVSVDSVMIVRDGLDRKVVFLLRFRDEDNFEYRVLMDEGEARSKYELMLKEFEEKSKVLLSSAVAVAEVRLIFVTHVL